MGAQLRIVSKKEAHDIIESLSGDCIMLLSFDESVGISGTGKRIKKKKGQKLVDHAKSLVFSDDDFVNTLNLYETFFADLSQYKIGKNKVKSILIPKLIPKLE